MQCPPAPPILGSAVAHAVLNGGSRIRPQLCLAVFQAASVSPSRPDASHSTADVPDAQIALISACALELMHCASLVHDDLPCFDDADVRRGKPTVHVLHDEATAVLVGDALIMRAFEIMGPLIARAPQRGLAAFQAVAQAVAMPHGITAGQGWEAEAEIDLEAYHRSKTGALFVAACRAGAEAAGSRDPRWPAFGAEIGRAYQIADDLKDCLLDASDMGKPGGQDARCDRPNAAQHHGVAEARRQLSETLRRALDICGPDAGARGLRGLVVAISEKILTPDAAADLRTHAGLSAGARDAAAEPTAPLTQPVPPQPRVTA
ncbi:MAG: polyprenyl synthetase family protein [Pseudomonadota bacterium]